MVNNVIIVVLDIGSTWIRAIICERDENGILRIMGTGVKPSTGLRKGVLVNIDATQQAIIAAIEDAEMMSGLEVKQCWTGIGGSHINTFNSKGAVGILGKKRDSREISQEDINRVIEQAKAVKIPIDRQILEVIPQSYKVDDQKEIRYPHGMLGVRLECEVHMITCTVTGAQNVIKCINRAGFMVNGIILKTLAAGRSVLTQDEMDLGVLLIDMGGGTTDTLVYVNGSPFSYHSIPAGGTQVTSDISILKNISMDNAEKIKIDAGCCWEQLMESDEFVIVPGVGGRPPVSIPRMHIMGIIKPRLEEIFKMVRQHIDSLNLSRNLGGGVVLTGGGAQLTGVTELAGHILGLPARLGSPIPCRELEGLVEDYRTPSYATAVGLVLEGAKRSGIEVSEENPEIYTGDKNNKNIVKKFTEWLTGEFF